MLKHCTAHDFNVITDNQLTRGEFAQRVWSAVKDQSPAAWKRLKADDADADGIPDVNDALPFSSETTSWP